MQKDEIGTSWFPISYLFIVKYPKSQLGLILLTYVQITGSIRLLLLPTSSEKLLAKLKGPYKVVKKIGKVNYEVLLDEARNKRKIFHIHMLQLWKDPTATCCNLEDEQEDIHCYSTQQQDIKDATYGKELMEEQLQEVQAIIQQYGAISNKKVGKTTSLSTRYLPGISQLYDKDHIE